jgi:hypothetical protein
MNYKVWWLALSVGTAMTSISVYADAPSVRTADEAIAVAKDLCAHFIPPDRVPSKWVAKVDSGAFSGWKGPGDGWRVDVEYDDSHGNTLSLIDMYIFIPKVGKPGDCYRLSN